MEPRNTQEEAIMFKCDMCHNKFEEAEWEHEGVDNYGNEIGKSKCPICGSEEFSLHCEETEGTYCVDFYKSIFSHFDRRMK